MKVYDAVYTKKNGDERKMRFARVQDLPTSFLQERVQGNNTEPRRYEEGIELVWDIDKSAFRTVNWNTMTKKVEEDRDINILYS